MPPGKVSPPDIMVCGRQGFWTRRVECEYRHQGLLSRAGEPGHMLFTRYTQGETRSVMRYPKVRQME
jgi:hypothetical protein